MQVVEPLGIKQVKVLTQFLIDQYGFIDELPYVFYIQNRTQKILMLTQIAANQRLDLIRINSQGLYFAEVNDAQTNFRLSIDASQLIGLSATKNCVELSEPLFQRWIRGETLPIDLELEQKLVDTYGYVLIKNTQGDFFGVGTQKDGELLNFVPKARRVQSKLEL